MDRAFPMVGAKDVGRVAADLIRQDWTGIRVVELEGPRRVSPHDLASMFAHVIGKPVRAVLVPRESWDQIFRSQGMKKPEPRMRMLDGFNEGWIEFQDGGSKAIKGHTTAVAVIAVSSKGHERDRDLVRSVRPSSGKIVTPIFEIVAGNFHVVYKKKTNHASLPTPSVEEPLSRCCCGCESPD
jgi:hypothetical protein